jgi:excisionase family DNA binding protein
MAGSTSPIGRDSGGIPREHGILTVIEVARELRCSKSHVHHLIDGRVRGVPPLPCLWLGRRRVVRRSSLDEWIKANEHGAMV